jgi:hypothetical protein
MNRFLNCYICYIFQCTCTKCNENDLKSKGLRGITHVFLHENLNPVGFGSLPQNGHAGRPSFGCFILTSTYEDAANAARLRSGVARR